MSKKHIKLPTAELKLPAADLIAADDIIEESAKSLADMIAEAKAKALKEGIKANTVIIDKHFAKVNAFHFAFGRAVMSLPPMICGLEVQVSDELPDGYDFAVLDIHAEATGEKLAIGYAYDGKINIIFGTHTHVQTADEKILPHGTGYITDVGMCGESGGILGMDAESVVTRMRTKISYKFKASEGAPEANGAIFTLDTKTGIVTEIKRITF